MLKHNYTGYTRGNPVTAPAYGMASLGEDPGYEATHKLA